MSQQLDDLLVKYSDILSYAECSVLLESIMKMKQIRACTEGKGGHAAFASIMWSPPATFPESHPKGFYDNLAKIECDVLLLFGSEDPWCTPAFAKRMFQSLIVRDDHPSKPVHRYIDLGKYYAQL